MYKVSSHSNHLFVKAGRPRALPVVGASNNNESSSSKRGSKTPSDNSSASQSDCSNQSQVMTSPKLTFKKTASKHSYQNGQPSHLTQGHEEMLRFVQTSWQQFMQEYQSKPDRGSDKIVYYERTVNGNNNHGTTDFKPFDLDEWLVQRMLQTVLQND